MLARKEIKAIDKQAKNLYNHCQDHHHLCTFPSKWDWLWSMTQSRKVHRKCLFI